MANTVGLMDGGLGPGPSSAPSRRGPIWPALIGKPKTPWLWGTRSDLFWVAGGGSLVFIGVMAPLSIAWPALSVHILALFAFLTWLCNAPHYVATYAVIYRERERQPLAWKRLRSSIPFVLGILAVSGVCFQEVAPFIARTYLTWSPYHYGAQNFGLAVMYAARSGAPLDQGDKRRVQLSFAAVSLFAMVLANSDVSQYARQLADPSVYLTTGLLGLVTYARLPTSVYYGALALFLGAAIQFSLVAVRRARAGRPLPLPTILLFLVHVTWFVVPRLRFHAGDHEWLGPVLSTWIPTFAIPFFHCAQYLGVTSWRARITSSVRPIPLFALVVVGGWLLFQGSVYVWQLTFDRSALEAVVVIQSLVNVHHFWIDGLIWKRGRVPEAAGPEARRREASGSVTALASGVRAIALPSRPLGPSGSVA